MDPTQHPNFLVPIALLGWIPVVVLLFVLLPPRRAAIAAYLIAWLFLPVYGYEITGLPDFTKMSATALGVLLATLMFASGSITRFRLRWFDLPMLAWCLIAFPSAMSNGFGPYEGATKAFHKFLEWGLPYFIGRTLIKDLDGVRDLAIGMVIGGLIYVPFCLWESRMSPNLHFYLYGFHQHSFAQTFRFGGWRPQVFMQHGLMVGMFMCMSGLIAYWLWRTRTVRALLGIPMILAAPGLLAVAVWCKSTGAVFLLIVGIGTLVVTRLLRWNVVIKTVCLVPIAYMALRTLGGWDGQELVDIARSVFGAQRAGSLAVRLETETDLWRIIEPRGKWLGAGRFNMIGWVSESGAQEGRAGIVPDGLWVIAIGESGLLGLASLCGAMVVPVLMFTKRFPVRVWRDPRVAPGAALAMVLAMYFIDCVFNAMINPLYFVALGAIAGAMPKRAPAAARWHQSEFIEPREEFVIARAGEALPPSPGVAM